MSTGVINLQVGTTSEQLNYILQNYRKIIFGPFVGEITWELLRWCSYVKRYTRENPHKEITISTRKHNVDLYSTATRVKCDTFDVDHGYDSKYSVPDGYDNVPLRPFVENEIDRLQKRYKDYVVINPTTMGNKWKKFLTDDVSYANQHMFLPGINNQYVINGILENHRLKRIITLFPRHRKHTAEGNWGEQNWINFVNRLTKTDKYFCFIAGLPGTIVENGIINHNIAFLYHHIIEENVSLSGLTIEAVRNSKVCVGSQNLGIVLSGLMHVPFVGWGHEKKRLTEEENPFNTKNYYIECKKDDYAKIPVEKVLELTESFFVNKVCVKDVEKLLASGEYLGD